jgi:hypothetical protein
MGSVFRIGRRGNVPTRHIHVMPDFAGASNLTAVLDGVAKKPRLESLVDRPRTVVYRNNVIGPFKSGARIAYPRDSLYRVITDLRSDRRYAIVMDAQNVEMFARLTHECFSEITTRMLEKFLTDDPGGRVLKKGLSIADAVHWLMHQIISYGFFGLKGDNAKQQRAYLNRMVTSVIIQ